MTTNPGQATDSRMPRIDLVLVFAVACVLLLSTRQNYSVLGMKGLPPALLMFVLIGALGVYAMLAGYRVSLGARGITFAILAFLLATLLSWHGLMTRLFPAPAFVQASQGLSALVVSMLAVIGTYYVFAANGARGAYVLETILKALLIGASISAMFALIQFATGIDIAAAIRIPGIMKYGDTGVAHGLVREGVVRAQGAAGHTLELSAVLTTIAPIGLALTYSAKAAGRRMWPWAALTAIVLAGIVVTVSRSAFIGLAAAILVMSWRWPVRRLVGMAAAALAAAALALVSGISVFDAIVKTFLGSSKDPSLLSRATGIQYVMAHWTEHVLLGQGTYTYPLGGTQPVLDDEYLSRLIECGVIGVLTLAALMVTAVVYTAKARKRCTDPVIAELINGVLGALVALIIVSTILDISAFYQISTVRWILVVLAAASWWLTAAPNSSTSVVPLAAGRAHS